ncbi:hypothetical protein [Burkholderia cenocepacia]|uniref:competence protein CoiA family protein n=1 Tax=Burkholderia cenocepacia TaxID=95486 RepID=UPI000761C124|nr:hypothetical protein [Burkholderia cenocepacia]KWU26362.1 hypothetical protein AS149_25575 [Burkholderia cenocepacia]
MSVFAHIAFARRRETGAVVAASELFQLEPEEYLCVACGEAVSLHYGRKGLVHFEHNARRDCAFGAAEGLRAAAIALIAREKTLCTPSLKDLARKKVRAKAAKPPLVGQEVWAEGEANARLEGVLFDYLAETLAGRLGVHVALQGEPSRSARAQLGDMPFPVLEIVLRKPETLRTFALLRAAVVEGVENKRWLSHPALEVEMTPLERQLGWEPSPVLLDGAPASRARLAVKVQPRGKAVLEDFADCDVFRQLPTHRKIEMLERRLAKKQVNWPAAVDVAVTGGDAFGVSQQVWQADVFSKFVHNAGPRQRRFTSDQVSAWLSRRYDVEPPFPNADRVAIYRYMLELVRLGFLADLRAQRYEVLRAPSPGAKGALVWVEHPHLSVSTLRCEAAAANLRLPLDQVERLLDAFDDVHPAEPVDSFVTGLAWRLNAPPATIIGFLRAAGVVLLAEEQRHSPAGDLF